MWPARSSRYWATSFTAIGSSGCGSAWLAVDDGSPQLGSRDCPSDLHWPNQSTAELHLLFFNQQPHCDRLSVTPLLPLRRLSMLPCAACHHAPSPTPSTGASFFHDGAVRPFGVGLCRRAPSRPLNRPHSPRPSYSAATRAAFPLPLPISPAQATSRVSGHPVDIHVWFFHAAYCSCNGGRGGAVADGGLLWPRRHHSPPHVCGPL